MKADQLLNELKILAAKLGIDISEQNFRNTGIAVKSGPCKVKGKDLFLIDKHLKTAKKVEVLAEHLSRMPLDADEIAPEVKAYLARCGVWPAEGEIQPVTGSDGANRSSIKKFT